MRRWLVFVGLVVVVAGVLAVSGAGGATGFVQARWVVTDLGTLGGKASSAAMINERGQIVGWSTTKAGKSRHAFIWQAGKMRDLGSLLGSSWATDLNERGQVVGMSVGRAKNPEGDRIVHAVLWTGGKLIDLVPKLSSLDCYGDGYRGSCDANGAMVNERGQVLVTMGSNVNGNLQIDRTFVWQCGKLTTLSPLGGEGWLSIWPSEISDRGEVVGASQTGVMVPNAGDIPIVHAFLWQNGKMRDLGTLPGKPESTASAINAHGQIAGWSAHSYGDGSGAVCTIQQGGKIRDLGVPGESCLATGINDEGWVVGWYMEIYPSSAGTDFLWENGNFHELGPTGESYGPLINARGTVISNGNVWQNGSKTQLPSLGGSGRAEVYAINDHDQIVGESTTKTGQTHAVLWTLKPGG